MAFTNFESKPAGYAGQVARGDQSLSRAWAETNNSEVNMAAGVFVAKHETLGVRPIAADADVVAGIVLRNALFPIVKPQEQASIMHIGEGDSVWAQMTDESALEKNSTVYIVATGDDAGKITDVEADNIATNYIVDRVSGDIAEITRKEV